MSAPKASAVPQPPVLSVRYRRSGDDWFVWDSFREQALPGCFATKKGAEAALKAAGRK